MQLQTSSSARWASWIGSAEDALPKVASPRRRVDT
jgi:hypothetical protein